MRTAAGGTQSTRLDYLPRNSKTASFAEPAKALHDRGVPNLFGRATVLTNHELALMRMFDIATGDKRTRCLDFVDQFMRE